MKKITNLLKTGICVVGMLWGGWVLADGTLTGTGGNWDVGGRWVGGISNMVNGPGQTASLDRTNMTAGITYNFVNATYTLGNFIITDTRASQSSNLGVTFNITNYDIAFDGNGYGSTISNGGNGTLTINGTARASSTLWIADSLTIDNSNTGGWALTVNAAYIKSSAVGSTVDLVLKSSADRIIVNSQIVGDLRLIADGAASYINLGQAPVGGAPLVNTYTGGTVLRGSALLRPYYATALGGGDITFESASATLSTMMATSILEENRVITNNVVLSTGGRLSTDGGTAGATYSGVISGTGALTINNTATSTTRITVNGVNTYQGGTIIERGDLFIFNDENLGATSGAVTLDGTSNTAVLHTESVSFSSNRQLNLIGTQGALGIGTGGYTVAWNGKVTGSGTLRKLYAGNLELTSNDSDYSGGTKVEGGGLIVSNTAGSATGIGEIVMGNTTSGNNTRLGGSGRIAPAAGNNITFVGTGRLDPKGTLTFALSGASKLVLSDAMTIELTLGTVSDQIVFETAGDWLQAGPSGIVNVNITEGTGFDSGISYDLFEGLTTQGITWNVTGVDGTIDWNGSGWALNVVPEPSTYAVLLGLAVLAGVMVRRRKS